MALAKSLMIFFLVMACFGVCFGAVYKVGDSEGWRYKGFNYTAWRLDKDFTVGDSLLFVYKGKDSVVQVDRKHYQTCNSTDPINETRSGNDTITLDKPGHFFYITGYKEHCERGQKLDIRVSPPTSPSPSPSPSQSPHKSSAPSIQSSAAIPALILMAMAVVVLSSTA
ncbi:mavicyanin-like [Rosa sericea]|uniref:mavicyanin-like n=1 Tax=Rosa rugosa TaxID=74645 RepID=UPI002B40B718|nr:mavicyanin-like [Rosa rugosa]